MIQSMTGFGRAEGSAAGWRCSVELRSVNSRFLDFRMRLPTPLANQEEPLKKLLRPRCERGKIEGTVALTPEDASRAPLVLNRPVIERYARLLNELTEIVHTPVQLTLTDLLNSREPLWFSGWEENRAAIEQLLADTFSQAVTSLIAMRKTEGRALAQELRARSARMRELLERIRPLTGEMPTVYAKRLRENLAKLVDSAGLEGGMPQADRIAQEIALLAERCDVSEELARFATHLDHLEVTLGEGGALGRKFEFLLQELNREANTLAVKSNDSTVSACVIEIKSELEKLREQIQNIE